MKKLLSFIILLLLPSFFIWAQKGIVMGKFKYKSHSNLKDIPEPSDIVWDSSSNHFFIVSDHGILFEADKEGNVIKKAQVEGVDFEGVEVKGDIVYVADESGRKVYLYNRNNLQFIKSFETPYNGKPNKGFESITFNYSKNCFVLISEKDPSILFEYDSTFHIIYQQELNVARDLSSARWWKGKMYLLSDEDACILVCDPFTYQVEKKYLLEILNPEGLCFDGDNKVFITSDDLQRIYFFNQLPQ